MGKPVRKEKKLLHPKMDAGCFPSLSSGKEFWFSKAVVVGSRGTNTRPSSLAVTGKGRQVMRHSTALCFFEENYGIRMAQSFRCDENAMSQKISQALKSIGINTATAIPPILFILYFIPHTFFSINQFLLPITDL